MKTGKVYLKNIKKSDWYLGSFVSGMALIILAAPTLLSGQVSLSSIVAQAQRTSSSVKLADADLQKAIAILAQTRDVYVPNFVLGSSIGPPSIGIPTGQPSIANATMQSLAFSFPQHQYILAARAGVDAANLNLKDAQEQVALDASNAYIELNTVTEELNTSKRQQEICDRLVSIEQQRADAGVDPLSEELQAKLTAAQIRLKLLHLQSRQRTLASQLAALTGLPASAMVTDPASIPEIPAIKPADAPSPGTLTYGIEAAQAQAESRHRQARGDELATRIFPQIGFGVQYNRDSTLLNNYSYYYSHFKADNFSAGFSIQLPLFDLIRHAKARESAAEALRATAEAEQAQRQNDVQIAMLAGNLRELDALAEIATLKQQIASEQLNAVRAQLQLGNGSGSEPGAPPQLSPKAEQLALIDQNQKLMDSLDAGFDLTKARLSLLRALGHMQDWLSELHPDVPAKEPRIASK
jgi:outer membrane protein TolC